MGLSDYIDNIKDRLSGISTNIHLLPLSVSEELPAVLQRYEKAMPCAILGFPSAEYRYDVEQVSADNLQSRPDIDFTFVFALCSNMANNADARAEWCASAIDEWNESVQYLPPEPHDENFERYPIETQEALFFETESIIAAVFTFKHRLVYPG